MKLSVAEADGQLAELVRLAERGAEVVLTEDGKEVARIVPSAQPKQTREEKRALFEEIRRMAEARGPYIGPSAARSQDYLYDELGLPK
ncbi:type II toxin-antitoxin system prevent-host-death family antitoxin [Rhizobium sp. TH2]|uniref:type II toxin-antitoxin system Phd/YefM family antitoxin n=1 Tax=Rhizobium sp. TH2 TaxID=2775403 RepID=UPI0021580705|nr:type II toxin-antitoxin system prevent-host-death family antitoxin [Rhizobium sp. TH2]UVC07898.1 type II toxin-antitoxin system prevent-host-death family antitoxin [Rhizobium sp. TH2]